MPPDGSERAGDLTGWRCKADRTPESWVRLAPSLGPFHVKLATSQSVAWVVTFDHSSRTDLSTGWREGREGREQEEGTKRRKKRERPGDVNPDTRYFVRYWTGWEIF